MTGHPKAAEARAILHSVKANLCPHGVPWRNCTQHDDKEVRGEVVASRTDQEGPAHDSRRTTHRPSP